MSPSEPVQVGTRSTAGLDGLQRTGRLARCVTVQGDSVLLRLGATPDTTAEPLSPDGC